MRRLAAACAAMAGGLAACAAPPPPAPPPGALQGVLWRLERLGGDPAPSGVTLAFGEGELRGAGPCNRYFGGFAREGARLALGPIAATRRACPGLDAEQRYFASLTEVASFVREGGRLEMRGPEGAPLLVFADR